MAETIIIRENIEVPKQRRTGRKKGNGSNIRALMNLKDEQSCLEVSEKKMQSIRHSAQAAKIQVIVRRVPPLNENDKKEPKYYYIFRKIL